VGLAAGREPVPIPDVDDGLLASAIDHGMQGLLWSWIRLHAPSYSERAALAGADLVTQRRHRQLWDTLAKVHHDLADAGVEVAAVKGVTFEARWYARTGERPSTDVDVLVDPGASSRAAEILDVVQPGHPLRREITELVGRNVMQSVNTRVDDVSVDLHFDLLKLGIPTRQRDIVWARMLDQSLPDGTTVRVPDAELALVHFLVHLNKDSFPRLLGYCDVARIARDERLDWGFVEHFLRGEGLDVVGERSLATVTAFLGLPPGDLPISRGPRARLWRAAWPERVTLLGSAGTTRSRRQDLLPFLARGRLGETIRWARAIVFPPPATVALQYPAVTGPYLWRLARGRLQTARARRRVLRARHAPAAPVASAAPAAPAAPADRDPSLVASLLRQRERSEPLWLDVHGRSMGWSIPDGARVRVEAATRPRRGEVWAFCNAGGDIVVHRYRGKAGEAHRFQGDARVRADGAVGAEQLIGRVVELAPARTRMRWGPAAGAIQRVPRLAIAVCARTARRVRSAGSR
jgi:hypothetical protein